MNVPFLDLKAQISLIRPEIDSAINQIINNTNFIGGPVLKDFESLFAKACGTNYGIGTSSGTSAIHMALHALGIGKGDEVIVPANTFIATAEPVVQCGARPVFVDVDPETALMLPDVVEKAITSKTKAIILVHLYGQLVQMSPFLKISEKKSIHIIEDAAQAHLSSQEGKMAGSFGICGCFSFFPGKNLGAFGDAGMVVTGNEKLAEKIGMLRDHGRKEKYVHEIAGFNERMDAIQAAVLRVKFRYLEEWNQKRRQKAERYDNSLRDVVSPIKREKNNNPIYHLYVIKTERRQELRDFLQKNKIETGIHYPVPLHLQPAFKFLCYKKGDFPVSEKLSETALSLPIFPEMTEEQQEFVIQKIYEFFR